jgi:hypothetical protein
MDVVGGSAGTANAPGLSESEAEGEMESAETEEEREARELREKQVRCRR